MLLILNRPNFNQYVGLPQQQQQQQPPTTTAATTAESRANTNQHVKFNTKVSFIAILMNLSVPTCAHVS